MLKMNDVTKEIAIANYFEGDTKPSKDQIAEMYSEYVRKQYVIESPKFDYKEVIKTIRPSLPVESPKFKEPSLEQIQFAHELIVRNFNEKSVLLTIIEQMDRSSLSELIANLRAIDDTPSAGQLSFYEYLEGRAKDFPQLQEVINNFRKEHQDFQNSKRLLSDVIGKLKPMNDYLLRKCPPAEIMNQVRSLHKQATGTEWKEIWTPYLEIETAQRLINNYRKCIEIDTRLYNGYDPEEHKRDDWLWNENQSESHYDGWNRSIIGGTQIATTKGIREEERKADRRRIHKEMIAKAKRAINENK